MKNSSPMLVISVIYPHSSVLISVYYLSWQSSALRFHPKILFLESCFIPAYLSNLAKPPQAITVTYKVMILSMESHIYLLNILLRQVTDSFFILHCVRIPQIQRVWPLLYGCNFYFPQCSAGPVTKVLILCDTFFLYFQIPSQGTLKFSLLSPRSNQTLWCPLRPAFWKGSCKRSELNS